MLAVFLGREFEAVPLCGGTAFLFHIAQQWHLLDASRR